jgi:hypothetical protein
MINIEEKNIRPQCVNQKTLPDGLRDKDADGMVQQLTLMTTTETLGSVKARNSLTE